MNRRACASTLPAPLLGAALAALGLLLAGCGARSGLDCRGERCALSDSDESPETGLGGSGGDDGLGNVPPVLVPPREGGIDPPEPPPEVPVEQPTTSCGRDGIWRGSMIITGADQLAELEGCREVEGDLLISGVSVDDLSELRELEVVGATLGLLSFSGSLGGLENLRSVNNLQLSAVSVPSLAPLASLLQIGSNPLDENAGVLNLSGLDGPTDLSGLGSIISLRTLVISQAGTLQSTAGLSLPATMNAITIESSPGLLDLVGLTQVIEVDALQLSGLGVQSLLGLENVARAGSLAILDMLNLLDLTFLGLTSLDVLVLEGSAVTNLDALSQLRSVENVVISGNPLLTNLAGLSQLQQLTELSLIENGSLVSLPEFTAVGVMEQLIVRRNPLLASGPSFPSLIDVDVLEVSENPALTEITGFTALADARRITIRRNAALTSVDLSQLNETRTLNISCNPLLPESSVEGLASVSGTAVISGNQGSAAPCAEPI